jgi:hypothetical protein
MDGVRIRELLDAHSVAIAALPERRRQVYDEIRGLSAVPELSPLHFPEAIEVPPDEARWARHLYVAADQLAPFRLNSWEEKAVRAEL